MSLRRASVAAAAAAAAWCLAGAAVVEPPALDEAGLPEGDDECQASGAGSEECALSAVQMRGARLAAAPGSGTSEEPAPADLDASLEAASGSWHGSCKAYGCHHGYHAEFKCQCTPDCARYGNCCYDFHEKCSVHAHSSQASCHTYGCNVGFHAERSCQCNAQCHQYGNCCSDYYQKCDAKTHHPVQQGPKTAPSEAKKQKQEEEQQQQQQQQEREQQHEQQEREQHHDQHDQQQGQEQQQHQSPSTPSTPSSPYRLNWDASGSKFFDGWDFLWNDDNHGSAEYLLKDDARKAGVTQAYPTHAILRAGAPSPKYLYKRQTAKIQSKRSWKHFLLTMKYTHLPFGCGVWPAFFTLGTKREWPKGGEFDVLEYVNADVSKSSVHMGAGCTLNQAAVDKYGSMPDRNDMGLDCHTDYSASKLGCAPNKWMRRGQDWSNSPGVVALEWTEDHIKIFAIPESEIPHDLSSDSPKPEAWDRWLFSYYPLAASGCTPDMLDPQKILLQINFCGDWASKVWSDDSQCKNRVQNCRAVDPLAEYQPDQDCCTQFIWNENNKHGADDELERNALFNITYLKVFTQS